MVEESYRRIPRMLAFVDFNFQLFLAVGESRFVFLQFSHGLV